MYRTVVSEFDLGPLKQYNMAKMDFWPFQTQKWQKMAIYNKTQTQNGLVGSKPLKFDVTDVERCLDKWSIGYGQNGENGQIG